MINHDNISASTMKQNILILLIAVCFTACTSNTPVPTDTATETVKVAAVLDSLNATAARADFTSYFNLYAANGVFTGTDATERWDKKAFMAWAKPIFDKGRAWSFTKLERHIYFEKTGTVAWFDELLNTQMKICRGSGVLVKEGSDWKIAQYILSTTIPNEQIDSIVQIKAPLEDKLIEKFSASK